MGLFDFVASAGEKLTEKVLGSTANDDAATSGSIECRSRLGGLLRYYHREAA